jgi:hypothetical protein
VKRPSMSSAAIAAVTSRSNGRSSYSTVPCKRPADRGSETVAYPRPSVHTSPVYASGALSLSFPRATLPRLRRRGNERAKAR